MKNDGLQMQPFFASSRYMTDGGCILPDIETLVSQFQPSARQSTSDSNSSETQPAIFALEAHLTQKLNGEKEFACFGISYDEIRQFSFLSNLTAQRHDAPVFVQWLMQNQFPVVHLLRKNPLNCYVQELSLIHI